MTSDSDQEVRLLIDAGMEFIPKYNEGGTAWYQNSEKGIGIYLFHRSGGEGKNHYDSKTTKRPSGEGRP